LSGGEGRFAIPTLDSGDTLSIMNLRPSFEWLSLPTAALLLMPAGVWAQSGQGSLERRVQRLEDVEEIRTLLIEYGRTLDKRDFAGYSKLFAKDGEWAGGFGSTKGPAAIQAFMEKNIPENPASKPGSTYHLMSNFVIEPHGDTATAWSRWTFIVTSADNKPSFMYAGHYEDSLVRENGKWRFKRRVAYNDIPHLDSPASK